MKNFTLFILMALSFSVAKSQVSLPYFTGFDDSNQQAGWVEYRLEGTALAHWGYNGYLPHSAPYYISHDYSPGSNVDLADDWFVSPAFLIPEGGTIDSVRYQFWGFSPGAEDTVAIYLLNGSQDPAIATRTLLADFRGTDYVNYEDTFRILTNIALPALNGNCYIGFRLRNTDIGSFWLTPHFDNLAISGNSSTGINDPMADTQNISIYPNPTNGRFIINATDHIYALNIYNSLGDVVYFDNLNGKNRTIETANLAKGVYIIQCTNSEGNRFTEKLIIQ